MLKAGEQITRGLGRNGQPFLDRRPGTVDEQRPAGGDLAAHVPLLHPVAHGGLDAAEAEVADVAFHVGRREPDGVGIAIGRQRVDHGPARIAESEQLGDFVERFAGGVVPRPADQPVGESFAHLEQMRMAAADHQRHGRQFQLLPVLHHDGVDVTFDMIDGDQRQVMHEADAFRIRDADQQGANKARPLRDGDRGQVGEARAGSVHGLAHDGSDGAQMLARGQLRHDAAVSGVHVELGSDDVRKDAFAVLNDGGGRFVAGRFNGEDLQRCCYSRKLKVADFHFDLPPELIAQEPLEDRAASRMLVVDRASGTWQDRMFRELPGFVRPGDCIVLNDTRVMRSRLYGRRAGGTGTVEVLFLREHNRERREWQALVRPGRRLHEGSVIEFDDTLGAVVVDTGERGERTLRLLGSGSLEDVMERLGHMPLPPYIRREDALQDRERYQTVYAREPGSAAAPTAGLHFTPEVLDACRAAGADVQHLTLHVGLGTFAPLRAETVEQIRLHAEHYRIAPEAARAIQDAPRRLCVGTTSVRTLESFARTGMLEGDTDLFIAPGFAFRLTNALLTNFHLPESSLLMLVSAFAGRELILDAYRHAVRERYRFFSYGDCMLIL